MNQNIKDAKRIYTILLVFIIVSLIVFMFFINMFLGQIINETSGNDDTGITVKNIFLIVELAICIVVGFVFYIKYIYKLGTMCNLTPVKCIIEDFIIYPYGREADSRRIDYRIAPLVRDLVNDKLYFTYGNYNLSYYNASEKRNGKTINKSIFRKDGSKVQIGDMVYAYIRKELKVNIDVDETNNMVKLNNSKMKFMHYNENYNINIFNDITFFEGIVEVEDIENDIKI